MIGALGALLNSLYAQKARHLQAQTGKPENTTMFGLADLKKINERAARKRYRAYGPHVYDDSKVAADVCDAVDNATAQKIADALNMAEAMAEANANAVGRT